MSIGRCASRALVATAGSLAFVVAAASVEAAVIDPVGDFLATYEGPQNGDLDVTLVNARITGPGQVRLIGQHADAIGSTEGAAYVWGIDRGQGTELLTMLPDPIAQGVLFDAVAILLPDETGSVIDLLAGTPPTPLDPSDISIAGDTISVVLTEALPPSSGFDFADYGYNLWPRYAPGGVDPLNNKQISDFAPNSSTFMAVIPVPGGTRPPGRRAGNAGLHLPSAASQGRVVDLIFLRQRGTRPRAGTSRIRPSRQSTSLPKYTYF